MALSMKIKRSVHDGTQTISFTQTVAAGLSIALDEEIPESASNEPVAFAADVSEAKVIFISASAPMTIYTNDVSGGSPDDTIELTTGKPLVLWVEGDDAGAKPLTVDVTGLFVTSATGGRLQIRYLADPTPDE